MAITGTGQLTQSLIEVMSGEFDMIVPKNYIYAHSPLTYVPDGGVLRRGAGYSSLRINTYHRLFPANSTRSEITDIAPVQLRDSAVTISHSLYGNTIQLSLKLQETASRDVFEIAAKILAENAGESVDFVARSVAVAGSAFELGNGASRDAVNETGVLTPGMLYNAAGYLASAPKLDGGLNQPTIGGGLAAIMRNAVIADLAENSSIILLGQYRDNAPETVLMGEIGAHMSGVRLVVSDWAKIFQGAGSTKVASSDNLSNAVNAGATTIAVSTALTSGTGTYLTIGTRETTANGEQTNVETVYAAALSSALAIAGGAPNGGLLFDHSSDSPVGAYNQVHAVVIFGAESIMKVFASDIGENPQLLPPKVDGSLDQWDMAEWRWYGGFGRRAENRLYRVEVGSNRQVLGF